MPRSLVSSLAILCLALGSGCRSTRVACPLVGPAARAAPAAVVDGADCPPPRADYPWRNLVFEGGGVKGLTYGGALEVLSQQGILDKVERVAGTSAGSITAVLVALRYTPEEIRTLLFNLDFKQFEDGGATGIFRLFRRFGWFEGDALLDTLRCIVGEKTGNRKSTFRELRAKGFLDLHMFSTDLTTGEVRDLSFDTTPDLEVALAARMSGSFPLFFAAIERDQDWFVDGGVVENYPVDTFDTKEGLNPETLGFVLLDPAQKPKRNEIRNLADYSRALAETILSVQVQDLENDPANLERTVILNDLGISTLDFDLTDAQKRAMIEQGVACTCSYLRDWQRWREQNRHPGQEALGSRVPIRKCGSAFGG